MSVLLEQADHHYKAAHALLGCAYDAISGEQVLAGELRTINAGHGGESPRAGANTDQIYSLAVHLLGSFEVRINGKRVEDWRASNTKTLFKYLVSRREKRATREELVEAVWPAGHSTSSANSLRVTVHSLRSLIRQHASGDDTPECIIHDGDSYSLNPSLAVWVDADEFDRHYKFARTLQRAGRNQEAMREHLSAEALYTGDFLEDDPYPDWALLRRAALKDAHLAVLETLSECSLSSKDFHACIDRSLRILQSDPCNEETYKRLMVCHAELGHPGLVRKWFDMCQVVMRQELDVAPSDETLSLLARLLRNGDESPGKLIGD